MYFLGDAIWLIMIPVPRDMVAVTQSIVTIAAAASDEIETSKCQVYDFRSKEVGQNEVI